MNWPDIINKLESRDSNIRNATAIELMDYGGEMAFECLVTALRKSDNRKRDGTLVYALTAFDCSTIFPLLFELSMSGYENAQHAVDIMAEQKMCLSEEDLNAAQQLLDDYRINDPDEGGFKTELIGALEDILARLTAGK